MACNLPVALNTDTRDPSRFDNLTVLEKVFAFLNSYFIVSKWQLVPKWNKSFFCPLVSSWTARAKL